MSFIVGNYRYFLRKALIFPPANFRPYTYWSLLVASWTISQHLGAIFIFLAVFVRLKERYLDPRLLIWLSITSFVAGASIWDVLVGPQDNTSRAAFRPCSFRVFAFVVLEVSNDRPHVAGAKIVKSSILVFLSLIGLSPILRTLTAATSSDSIWALSACLLILNVLLADYSSLEAGRRPRERCACSPHFIPLLARSEPSHFAC